MPYKLLKKEINELDNYWNFIELFNPYSSNKSLDKFERPKNSDFLYDVLDYRKDLIKRIMQKYTSLDFYKYEKILNKLLWNLIEHVNFDINDIIVTTYSKLYNLYKTSYNSCSSYSHKQYLYDEKHSTYYLFGYYIKICSYPIINKIFETLCDRDLYEKVMNDKKYFNKIINKFHGLFYYPNDYPFPNINLLFYNENNKLIFGNGLIELINYILILIMSGISFVKISRNFVFSSIYNIFFI